MEGDLMKTQRSFFHPIISFDSDRKRGYWPLLRNATGLLVLLFWLVPTFAYAQVNSHSAIAGNFGNDSITPAVVQNSDGRLEVFARGNDNAIYHKWETCVGCGWSVWASLGGSFVNDPAVGINYNGRLEVFARGSDDLVYHSYETCAGCGGWTSWATFSNQLFGGNIAVGQDTDGRLEIFSLGFSDGQVYGNYQVCVGCGWSGWYSLGGNFSGRAPTVIRNSDGRLEVFAGSTIYHKWQNCAGCGWSSGWASLGGQAINGVITAAVNSSGRVELFTNFRTASGTAIYHIWQNCASCSTSWSGWNSLGGNMAAYAPGVGKDQDGRLEVFAVDNNNVSMDHMYQTCVGCGWSNWQNMGGQFAGSAVVALNQNGVLEVFALNLGTDIIHSWQNCPGCGWGSWYVL